MNSAESRSSSNRLPASAGEAAKPATPDENSRLDEAMKRADELLVSSLRSEEVRRQRRKTLALLAGGIVMCGLIAVVWLVLVAAPAGGANPNATALAQEGWSAWQQGKLDEAETKFAKAVEINPKLSSAWNGLGWAQFNGGKSDEAIKSFEQCVKLEPTHPAALNGLGQAYLAKGDLAKAETYLTKAAAGGATAAWYGLAKVYLLQQKWDDAAKWSQKILDSGDKSAQVLVDAAKEHKIPEIIKPVPATSPEVQKGWQALNGGDTVNAREMFQLAIKNNPKDVDAYNGLGWLELNLGKLDEAKSNFEKALANGSSHAGAMNGLARVYKQQDKIDQAIEIWEKMVKEVPGVHAGTYGLAGAYMEKKEYAKAIPLYEEIVKANPNDQQAKAQLETAKAAKKS